MAAKTAETAPTGTSFSRHFRGWQLGVVSVGMAALSVLLVVPRPVAPRELPTPRVDRRQQARERAALAERAQDAEVRPLPFLVRAVGEALRRYGAAEASSQTAEVDALGDALRERVRDARKHHGDAPLLALQAVQARLFVRAATAWADTGERTRELEELGGAFARLAAENRWVDPGRGSALAPDELEVLFTVRWARLCGVLDASPFSPSLTDFRVYYRALLLHPEAQATPGELGEALGRYVDALARRDPEYPAALARGVLAHWSGDADGAVTQLQSHLRSHPTGPYRLRALNYLLSAREHLPEEP